jgi:hypothetical protein
MDSITIPLRVLELKLLYKRSLGRLTSSRDQMREVVQKRVVKEWTQIQEKHLHGRLEEAWL